VDPDRVEISPAERAAELQRLLWGRFEFAGQDWPPLLMRAAEFGYPKLRPAACTLDGSWRDLPGDEGPEPVARDNGVHKMLAHLSGCAVEKCGRVFQVADLLNDRRERRRLVLVLHRYQDRLEGHEDDNVFELRQLLELGATVTILREGETLAVTVNRAGREAVQTGRTSPHNYLRDALDLLGECLEELEELEE
jgi:hypothetical protein